MPPRRLARALAVVLAGAALVIVLALVVTALWQKRVQTLTEATRTTQNLARTLEANAIDAVHAADLVLASLVDTLQQQAPGAPPETAELHRALVTRMRPWAPYRELVVTDAAGRLLTSAAAETRTLNLGDRDYFTVLRDGPAIELYVSEPFFSRVSATWSLAVSRRFARPDGTFGGVVAAIIDLGRFERFYATLDVGRNGNVTLWNGAATRILARYPADPTLLGENVRGPLAERRAAGASEGIIEGTSSVDGVERLVAFRRVGDLPLVISIGLAMDAVLEGWGAEAKLYGAVALAGLAGLVLLAGIVLQQIDRQRRLIAALADGKAALRASEQRFRDFAETASDWYWETDADHRFSYVSERIRAFGVEPAALLGQRRTDVALDQDEDEAKWRAHLTELARREPFANFIYRYSAADGSARYSSTSGKPLFDRTGRFLGYRGTGRDVRP